MNNHLLRHFVYAVLSLALGACVSVNIPSSAGRPAQDVKYNEPTKPFQDIKVKTADKAWISGKTGNTISYLSDCNSSTDPALIQLQNESLAVLDKLNIVESKNIDFNGRDALSTTAEGEVDGVPVKTQLLVFKKNNCNFTLNYGGLRNNFDAELAQFHRFTESFRAP